MLAASYCVMNTTLFSEITRVVNVVSIAYSATYDSAGNVQNKICQPGRRRAMTYAFAKGYAAHAAYAGHVAFV